MLSFLLQSLKQVDGKRAAIEVLIVVVVGLGAYLRLQTIELEKLRAVYDHPQTVVRVRIYRKEGPVRIVTRIVEKAGGEKETVIQEDRAPEEETIGNDTTVTPVPVSITMAPARTDRYLLGADLRNMDPKNPNAYSVYGGYSFRNRLDVLLGLGKPDRWESHVLLVARF